MPRFQGIPVDQPQATTGGRFGGIPIDEMPRAARSATDDMSTMDRFMSGVGQGMTSAVNSVEQLVANYPWLLGTSAGAIPPGMADLTNRRANENARLDAALLDTNAGKFGSIGGEMVATLPAGMGGKAAQGAGWLAKTLNAARIGAQGGAAAGAMQPVLGDDQANFAGKKAEQIGLGAAVGGGSGGLLNRAGSLLENLVPSNALATVANVMGGRANRGAIAKEGEDIAKKLGIDFTPAQVNADPSMTMAENMARQSIFSRSMVAQGDQKRTQQLADALDRTLTGISKSGVSPGEAGAQVQGAVKRTVQSLESLRSKQAALDYGELRRATHGSIKIEPDSLRAELSDLLAQHSDMGTASSDALASFAKRHLEGGATSGNLDKLLMLRQNLSKVSGGQQKISGDAQDRMIAAKMLKAIDDDLEMNVAKMPADVGALLSKANKNYRDVSGQIDSVEASPLGRILGDDMAGALQSGQFNTIAGETAMAKLSKLHPTELGVVRGMLEKNQPEAWASFKRSYLETAIEKAKEMPASAGVNTPVMRPTSFVKNVGDQKRLEAIYSPTEVSEINAAVNAARRMGDSTGYNFSGTAPAQEALGLMNKVTSGGLKAVTEVGSLALGSRKLARLMNDNKGRATLLELSRLPPQSQRARQLAAQLAAISAADESSEP